MFSAHCIVHAFRAVFHGCVYSPGAILIIYCLLVTRVSSFVLFLYCGLEPSGRFVRLRPFTDPTHWYPVSYWMARSVDARACVRDSTCTCFYEFKNIYCVATSWPASPFQFCFIFIGSILHYWLTRNSPIHCINTTQISYDVSAIGP